MNGILLALAMWAGLSIALSPLLARMIREPMSTNSLGGTPAQPPAEGRARPVEAAGPLAALPGASSTSSLPADSAPGSGAASPAPQQRDDARAAAGDAFHFPTPHVGDGPE